MLTIWEEVFINPEEVCNAMAQKTRKINIMLL